MLEECYEDACEKISMLTVESTLYSPKHVTYWTSARIVIKTSILSSKCSCFVLPLIDGGGSPLTKTIPAANELVDLFQIRMVNTRSLRSASPTLVLCIKQGLDQELTRDVEKNRDRQIAAYHGRQTQKTHDQY